MIIPFSNEQQKITTSGLIMNVDAGDVSSYSGTGSTFSDLTNNRRNLSIVGSPTFFTASNNSSYFDFNLTNANNSFAFNGLTVSSNTSYTFGIWVFFRTSGNSIFFNFGGGSTINNSAFSLYSTTSTRNIRLSFNAGTFRTITSTTIIPPTGWAYVVGIWNYGTGASLYVNGLFDSSLSDTGNLIPGTFPGVYLPAVINGAVPYYGNISTLHIYNRVLTAQEVSQNFNVLRGRYGI